MTEENTKTQQYSIYDQARLGSRWFDVRPIIGNGGKYLTGHYSGSLGGNGQSLDDIVDDLNK